MSIRTCKLAYDRLAGLDDIVMGEQKEPVDPAEQARRKRQLVHVKQEEEVQTEDDERGGREPNQGIRQFSKALQQTDAHKAKKQRC